MVVAGYYEQLELIKEKFPDKVTLTVQECADLMGIDRKTAYSMTKRVKDPLPAKKIGTKKILVPIPSLARWLCLRK